MVYLFSLKTTVYLFSAWGTIALFGTILWYLKQRLGEDSKRLGIMAIVSAVFCVYFFLMAVTYPAYTNCGERVNTDYCTHCGEVVKENIMLICPSCGAECDTPFCGNCGTKLNLEG